MKCGWWIRICSGSSRIGDHLTTLADEPVGGRIAGVALGDQHSQPTIILGHAFARRGQLGLKPCKVVVALNVKQVEKLVPAELRHAALLRLPKFELQLVAQTFAQRWIVRVKSVGNGVHLREKVIAHQVGGLCRRNARGIMQDGPLLTQSHSPAGSRYLPRHPQAR